MSDHETYEGGFDALMQRALGRRDALEFAEGEALPPLDVDLVPLLTQITTQDPPVSRSTFEQKKRTLQAEFNGEPALCCLNGLLIAVLRKTEYPDHAPALFHRIWEEHSDFLLKNLQMRWLVSSITTFGDVGLNAEQRLNGRTLTMLFGAMKLYEFERLYSGLPPSKPYTTRNKNRAALPLDMQSFSLQAGGLDVALLSRLWEDSELDPVVEPLAKHLLREINHEPHSIFRRLKSMSDERTEHLARGNPNPIPVRPRKVKTNPDEIRWGVVATMNSDVSKTINFVAYHLAMGADKVLLYADQSDDIPMGLDQHPKVEVLDAKPPVISDKRRAALHQRNSRKAHYFNHALKRTRLDWLAMLDTDEFLIAHEDIRVTLASRPKDEAFIKLSVFEAFGDNSNIYRSPAGTWGLPSSAYMQYFPTFGPYLPDLVIGQASPRLFLRSKLSNVRVGNFAVKHNGTRASNGSATPDLVVAHRHCIDFEDFSNAFPRRLDQGYTIQQHRSSGVKAILETLGMIDKPDLRPLYDELVAPRPEVIAMLTQCGAIAEFDLRLDEHIESFFEDLEE